VRTLFFYYTTCGWMMWNWLVSSSPRERGSCCSTALRSSRAPMLLWQLAQDEEVSVFGTSAKYLAAVEKATSSPKDPRPHTPQGGSFHRLFRSPSKSFEYVYREIKEDLVLSSISGGTDIISCFALGNPIGPV